MKTTLKQLIIISTLIISLTSTIDSLGQKIDSTMITGSLTGDTLYIIHKNMTKCKFLGNSWYTGVSYSWARSNELTINFGRTYGKSFSSPGDQNINMKSWGIGYSFYKRGENNGRTISAFGEISNFYLPPGTLRLDYIYDLTTTNQYLRPAVGINLAALDLMYSYSFKLFGDKNHFKHGFIIRLKYYLKNKNWQYNYTSR